MLPPEARLPQRPFGHWHLVRNGIVAVVVDYSSRTELTLERLPEFAKRLEYYSTQLVQSIQHLLALEFRPASRCTGLDLADFGTFEPLALPASR